MSKVIFFAVLTLLACGQNAASAAEANLADFAALTLRGSRAFIQPQLALKLFDSLEPKPSDNVRSNGYFTCKNRGQGIAALVECRIDTHDHDNRKFTVAKIEIIGEPFVGFEILTSKAEVFAGLSTDDAGWIQCEKDKSVCRFRVK